MTGRVIKSTGSWYIVEGDNTERFECRIKGKIRMKGLRTTNPVAVGDLVEFEKEPDQPTAVISKVNPRFNYILRKSINQSHEVQILAANMDQAVLLVTLAQPRTSLGFIDRYLVSAEAFHVPVTLLFNKFDIYGEDNLESVREIEAIYTKLGYPIQEVSVLENTGIEELNDLLRGKISLISGHSGVGKSTLINSLIPGLDLRTSEISDSSEKGIHTTTFAEMFDFPGGGYIIDTPGIRELGIIGIEKEELGHYFREMKALMPNCKYHNCHHIHEPGCAVIEGVETGDVEASRYDSYCSIYLNRDTRY